MILLKNTFKMSSHLSVYNDFEILTKLATLDAILDCEGLNPFKPFYFKWIWFYSKIPSKWALIWVFTMILKFWLNWRPYWTPSWIVREASGVGDDTRLENDKWTINYRKKQKTACHLSVQGSRDIWLPASGLFSIHNRNVTQKLYAYGSLKLHQCSTKFT